MAAIVWQLIQIHGSKLAINLQTMQCKEFVAVVVRGTKMAINIAL